ncbi:hypothetical protein [Pseudomarimonas salicorniae]|uniref:Uncharacterized protein n=1 Tax=Pseudomarimonas salicorniae TaxID=2933270 RepID=A0ABT0GGW4_9GAMM|nr:hypothetical protein [Lysobacter sp. CAU 1642]MCK7593784.1 hypothetical protein [Lysobacter sp. CAU 1642]
MHAAHVTHLAGRWWAIEGGTLRSMPEYPDIEGPVALLSDLDGAHNAVLALQGNASAAVPLIEQRLRRDGVTDGESHVEMVRLSVLGNSFQALFSAVPMADWQRLVGWSEQGGDHRLLFPLLKVVESRLAPGEAAVVRYERRVFFLSVGNKACAYVDALAFDDDADSVAGSLGALADRVRATLAAGERPQVLHWYALDTPEGVDEQSLASSFGEAVGLEPRMAAMTTLRGSDGESFRSALPELFKGLRPSCSASPKLSLAAYAGERMLPWLAAAAAVAALVIGYLAFDLDTANAARDEAAAEHRAEVEQIDATLRAEPAPSIGSELTNTRAFVERLARAERNGDLVDELGRVRQLSSELVRILRVRLDPATGKMVIEGVMLPGEGAEMRLSRFVDRLRGAGLSPVTVPPPQGNQIAGFFSYAISRTAQVRPEAGA